MALTVSRRGDTAEYLKGPVGGRTQVICNKVKRPSQDRVKNPGLESHYKSGFLNLSTTDIAAG